MKNQIYLNNRNGYGEKACNLKSEQWSVKIRSPGGESPKSLFLQLVQQWK